MLCLLKKRLALLILAFLAVNIASPSDNPSFFVSHLALDPTNKASLQHGAQIYFNYCSSCHSLKYARYAEIGHLIGVEDAQHHLYADLIQKTMMFDPHGDITQTIESSFSIQDAQQWFGVVPPDLTNETALRSPAWVYNYLRAFYQDTSRPTGTNNLILSNSTMPNVLSSLRGQTLPIFSDQQFDHFTTVQSGKLKPLEFDHAMYDLVNFLNVVAEPEYVLSVWIGIIVLAFLLILFMMVYFWYRTFHKDAS